MSNVRIGDICYVFDGPHATPAKIDEGPIYLGIDAITDDGRLNPAEYNHLSEEDYKKWTKRVTPQKDDIVFSYEATLGRYAMIPDGFYGCLGRRLAIVRAKDSRVNPKWLYYYFLSPEWKVFIANHTVRGSTVDRISVEDFPEYPVPLPKREEQDAIVKVLSQIDMRIDTNIRICDELEAIAKTIYDYWFTQFDFPDADGKPYRSSGGEMEWNEQLKRKIPQGWGVTTIGKVTRNHDSKRIPLSQNERDSMKGDIPYYGATGIMDYVNRHIFDGHYVLIAEDGSVMDSKGNPIVQMIWGKTWVNNHAHVLEGCNGYSNELLYLLLHRIPVVKIMTGSIQKKINQDNLNGYRIPQIPASIAKAFSDIVKPMFEGIQALQRENGELTKLRDWLLPMLMNGQATVADAEEEVCKVIPFTPKTVEVRQAARNFGDKKNDDTADLVKAYMRRKKDDPKP